MKMNKRIASAIVVLSLVRAGQAEEAMSTSAVAKETFWQQTKALVPVQIVLPPDYVAEEHRTMVMVLHGYANSVEKFQGPAERLAAAGFVAVLPESPYAFVSEWGLGYDWTLYNRGDADLQERARRLMVTETLPAVAGEVKRRYEIDDIYVLGFSQGARVAVQTCIYASELFKGAITFGLSEYKSAWFDDIRPGICSPYSLSAFSWRAGRVGGGRHFRASPPSSFRRGIRGEPATFPGRTRRTGRRVGLCRTVDPQQ